MALQKMQSIFTCIVGNVTGRCARLQQKLEDGAASTSEPAQPDAQAAAAHQRDDVAGPEAGIDEDNEDDEGSANEASSEEV